MRALIAKLTTAQSLMMEKGWWTNEAGHLTDAALWIDRAMKDAEALSHMEGWRPIDGADCYTDPHYISLPPSPTGGEE